MVTHAVRRTLVALSGLLFPAAALAQPPPGGGNQGIFLLEPIGGVQQIPVQGNEGLGVMGAYLSLVYPWIVGMAAATAVLMALWGGIQIIQSGSDTSKRDAGKNRLLMSLGGLLLILLSATIMNAFNPTFFQ